MVKKPKVLVFGASGSIGSTCVSNLSNEFEVHKGSRLLEEIDDQEIYTSIIWAQGQNLTKSLMETTDAEWNEVFDANLNFVRNSLRLLIDRKQLANPASLIFISSVWSNFSRVNKSAYMSSKSGLDGFARALAVELAPIGVRVNSVLPGIVDNQMTQKNLTKEQMANIQDQTPNKKLVSADEVANVVRFLASEGSIGITGQSLIVDNGWSIARIF